MKKKTFNIDAALLAEARQACGAHTDTDAIRQGLEALLQRAASQRMIAYLGTESDAQDVPRGRETPARKKRIA
jgi:Arc/MetJ family transcription regulator